MAPRGAKSASKAEAKFHSARKRVLACDRCRAKKSKVCGKACDEQCDGAIPCSRCQMKNAVCINRRQNKTNNRVRFKEYFENIEQHQAWLNNRQPYTDNMVSESSVLSEINNQSTERYSEVDSMLTPESCLVTPDCPQSPLMPLPFLSNPLNDSQIDHKPPLSSPTAFESYFECLTWEACDLCQIDGIVQDSIGPLILHTLEDRPIEGFSPAYKESTVIYNESPFSEDPDLLLSALNTHIFMGCASLEMGLDSKNDDTR